MMESGLVVVRGEGWVLVRNEEDRLVLDVRSASVSLRAGEGRVTVSLALPDDFIDEVLRNKRALRSSTKG